MEARRNSEPEGWDLRKTAYYNGGSNVKITSAIPPARLNRLRVSEIVLLWVDQVVRRKALSERRLR